MARSFRDISPYYIKHSKPTQVKLHILRIIHRIFL